MTADISGSLQLSHAGGSPTARTTGPVERLGYSIAEACEAISCSRSHLYRAMKRGHLRFSKDGKKVLISRQALLDYMERGDGTLNQGTHPGDTHEALFTCSSPGRS